MSKQVVRKVVFFLLLISLSQITYAKTIRWRMQSFMPATSNLHQYLQEFCDKVEVVTDGQLKITLFPGNALFPNLKVFKNLKAGVVDLAHTSVIFYAGEFPEGVVFTPPYGMESYEDNYLAMDSSGMQDLFKPFYDKHGLVKRSVFGVGREPLFSRVPIRTIADFKGKKIRMMGASAKFFADNLGVSVTQLGPGDLFTALNNGAIDATEFTGGSMDYALGLHKVTKYIIMPPYMGSGPTEFLINKRSYDRLPEDIREKFETVRIWAALYITQKLLVDDIEALKKMTVEGNMEVIWLSKEDQTKIRKMAVQYWDKELAGFSQKTKQAIEIYKSIARERGLIQ